MQRTPRLLPTSGISTQGTLLLALIGAGTAVFLFFLFPRMTTSAAGRSGPTALPLPGVERAGATHDKVLLVQDAPSLDEKDEAEVQPVVAAPSESVAAAAALSATGSEPKPNAFKRGKKDPALLSKVEPNELRSLGKERGSTPPKKRAASQAAPSGGGQKKAKAEAKKTRPADRQLKRKGG